jgi:hypothetical protein
MPPWVFRLVSQDWNAPCFTSFDKDYVPSLLQLEAPRRASIFPCSANFSAPWTCQMAATWLSGQPSWLGSFPSSRHPTSFREVLGTEFYSSDTPMSSSRMREQSLKPDIRKQISSEIRKSVSPFLKFRETNFALCWPSGPSSKLSRLSRLSPPSPMPLSVGSTTSSYKVGSNGWPASLGLILNGLVATLYAGGGCYLCRRVRCPSLLHQVAGRLVQ